MAENEEKTTNPMPVSTGSIEPDTNAEPLTKVEQAALLLLGMGEDIAAGVLRNFSRNEVQKVAKAMSTLSDIKTTQAKGVIEEFFSDYKKHSGIQAASKNFIDNMLNRALDGNIAKGLVADLYGDEIKNKMKKLQWISADMLLKTIANENVKMQSVFLAYLPPETSSEILSSLSEEVRVDIMYRITQIDDLEANVADDLLELIERCTEQYTENKSGTLKGVKQVADIINRFAGDKASVINSLKEINQDVVEMIEDDMFDFYIISNQSDATLEEIHKVVGPELWAVALKGTTPEFKTVIQGALSKRMGDELLRQINNLGPVPVSQVIKAQSEIMEIIKNLSDTNVIELLLYAENTVE